jgi:kinesin family protein C2/C3
MKTAKESEYVSFENACGILQRGTWLKLIGFSDDSVQDKFFWLSDDLREIRLGNYSKDSHCSTFYLENVVGMTFGPETTSFSQSTSRNLLLPWCCFSLIFVGRTIDLCSITDDAHIWFLALQRVVSVHGYLLLPRMSHADVIRRKVWFKIQYKASKMNRSLRDHFRLTLSLTLQRREYPKKFGASGLTTLLGGVDSLRGSAKELRHELLKYREQQMGIVQDSIVKIIREIVSRRPLRVDRSEYENMLQTQLDAEVLARRKLHDELMELKGNIRVYTRVRPLLEYEKYHGSAVSESAESLTVYNENDARKRNFEFDYVFHQLATQKEVFDQFEPFIQSFIDGYNVCLFAYGVTNSGKTYTMEGTMENPGVTLRALELIFRKIKNQGSSVLISCVQIYNETIYDLLNDMATLELRNIEGESFEPDKVTLVKVESYDAALTVMQTAALRRSTNSTRLNESSSRSHLVVTVRLESADVKAKLNLVDLAGSENVNRSGATGKILQEAKYINKSLSALGDVIHALIEAKKRISNQHIPFRNSKLTMLLRDSLQGNSKTVMIVQVSPSATDVVETLNTLQFASRVRTVEMGKPRKLGSQREIDSPVRE